MNVYQPVNEQLGYCFHPPHEADNFGHAQLDVVIRPAPTHEHFDPESVTCLVAGGHGSSRLHVVHPWTQDSLYRVCAGEIDVEDVRQQHVRAFTFGGELRLDSDARRTVCQIVSPVPLLEHARQTLSLEEHLIEEVQILFAERRAVQDDDVFDRKLAAVDPLQLYRACLVTLDEKLTHFPTTDGLPHRFKQFLHDAMQSWAAESVPALADLL